MTNKIYSSKELQLVATGNPGPYLDEFLLDLAHIRNGKFSICNFKEKADDAVLIGITKNLQKANLIDEITQIDAAGTTITHKGLKKVLPAYSNLEDLQLSCGLRLDLVMPVLHDTLSAFETLTICKTVVSTNTQHTLVLGRKQFHKKGLSDDKFRLMKIDLQSSRLIQRISEIELIGFKAHRTWLDITARTTCSFVKKFTGLRVLKLDDREEFRALVPALRTALVQLPQFEQLVLCPEDGAPRVVPL